MTDPTVPFVSRDAVARGKISEGREEAIAKLRLLDCGRRLREILALQGIWMLGAWIVVYAMSLSGQWHWPILVVGLLLAALGLNANVLLLHEGMHYTLAASRTVNRWGSALLGATVLISFHAYRVMHTSHHVFLGDPRDPDDYRRVANNRGTLFLMQYLRISIGALVYIFAIPFGAWKRGNKEDRLGMIADYALMVMVYSLLVWLVPGRLLVSVWLLPLILVVWMTGVRGLTQHGLTDSEDGFTASRTILANPVTEFLLLSENFHLEHHLFPEVPSYHLHHLHELIWPHLPRSTSAKSYLGFLRQFIRASANLDEGPIGLNEQIKVENAAFPKRVS